MDGWKWILIGLVAVVALVFGLRALGTLQWNRTTSALMDRMEKARLPLVAVRFDPAELEGLPAPVRRYLQLALTPGQPIIAAADVDHDGTFNMSETGDNWKNFTSTQRVTTSPPGFVWDGRIVMMPGLPVHVHDAYVDGEGTLHPALIGLVSLMNLTGGGEIAQGELMRYLAEATWHPTSLLPSRGIVWTAIDEHSARASLTDHGIDLSMVFAFGEDGMVSSMTADKRGRTVGGKIVMTPWQGRMWNYQRIDGMMVPMNGEVGWLTPEGYRPYWRGEIRRIAFSFAD